MAFRSDFGSSKERFLIYNGLAGLVKALEGISTTIDMRNDCTVSGTIELVDGYMNVSMKNAVFIDARGSKHFLEQFFITKRNVRYVHIPPQFKPRDLLKSQIDRMKYKPAPQKEKPAFKVKRALQRQMEIVAEIQDHE